MTRRRNRLPLSNWQKLAQSELRALRSKFPKELSVRLPGELDHGWLVVEITLNTESLRPPVPGGLELDESETFLVAIPELNLVPPRVLTRHTRFLGFPHVLAGWELCLYLDPAREWLPGHGMGGLLNRLWAWLDDAINARFDPSTALYHAVGGVPHASSGAPTIVVHHPINDSMRAATGHLVLRTGHRHDHHPGILSDENRIPMPIFVLPHNLPFGGGRDRLVELLQRLDHADHRALPLSLAEPPRHAERYDDSAVSTVAAGSSYCQRDLQLPAVIWPPAPSMRPAALTTASALLTVLAASAARQPEGSPQYVLLGVPHPVGGPPHLLGLRLPASVGDAFRRAVHTRASTIVNLSSSDIPDDIAMEWCPVSDERPEVTARRDVTRPVNVLEGKLIHIWGCGGLGSWIAEFAVRASARKVVICDPSTVTGGLLVRQNFTENDIGDTKATGLGERLRAISDITEIEIHAGLLPADWESAATTADLIVDATISLAITQIMEAIAADPNRRATLAQVATDSRTGTLGLALVISPGSDSSLQQIDTATGAAVTRAPELEGYGAFWSEPGPDDELTPTRGCSAPTFHGSAADMAAIAGTLLSLVGLSIQAGASGAHLVALPHAGVTPSHSFITSTAAAIATSSAA